VTFANGVTVTRLRGDTVDDGYNGSRIDWTTPDELEIPGCALAPRVEPELRDDGRQGVFHAWTLYMPYGADIAAHDRVDTPQGLFEVEGEPGDWRSPYTGREHGATVHLQRIDG
jgi:hypothetical protein